MATRTAELFDASAERRVRLLRHIQQRQQDDNGKETYRQARLFLIRVFLLAALFARSSGTDFPTNGCRARRTSLQLEGTGVQLIVLSALCDEFLVAAALDNPSVVKHHDCIGVLNGGQTVSDDEHGSALH